MIQHDEGRVTRWIVGTALLGAIGVGVVALGWPREKHETPVPTGGATSAGGETAIATDGAAPDAMPSTAPAATRTAVVPVRSSVVPANAIATLSRASSVVAFDRMIEIVDAQLACREQSAIDVDRDRAGEYGYLGELAGAVPIRAHASVTDTRLHLLPHAFGRVQGGVAVRDGYCFRIFLPGVSGVPLGEAEHGGTGQPAPDPQAAEQSWCCYAWPAVADGELGPALFTDQRGRVIVTDNAAGRYVGRERGPQPDAALGRRTAGRIGQSTAADDPDGRGRDGEIWRHASRPEAIRAVVRVVDSAARAVPNARIQVMVRPAIPRAGGGEFFEALMEQSRAMDWLEGQGLRLPVGTSGVAGEDGEVELTGHGVTGVAIMLRHPDQLDPQGHLIARGRPGLPTRLAMRDGVLQVELPPGIEPVAHPNANEAAAIATLKNIASAQAQCRASALIDVNDNGAGEYGYLAELAGSALLRAAGGLSEQRMSPPFLSGAFGHLQHEQSPMAGIVLRSGYCFQVWLPDAAFTAVPESSSGGAGAVHPDPARSEAMWCAYAWPVVRGQSGKRAFFVSQSGLVLASNNDLSQYSGFGNTPRPTAAYVNGGAMDTLLETNAIGGDGQKWTIVN